MTKFQLLQSALPPKKEAAPEQKSSFPLSIKSMLAAGALLGIVVTCMILLDNSGFLILPPQIDNLTEDQRQDRLNAFNALGTIHLAIVPEDDKSKAIDSMQLSPKARQSFQMDLSKMPSISSQTTDHQSAPFTTLASSQPIAAQSSATSVSVSVEQPAQELTPNKAQQMQLAWITLWDSDTNDGEMVRIDSEGYSRTIILKESPVTFAVPVPANGIINVTGIRDGDGGGITVGLASGNLKAVLPIISVGQVFPLKVETK